MTIPYRISQIETRQFAIFPEAYISGTDVAVESGFTFGTKSDKTSVRCIATFRYKQEERLLLILEAACYFDIAPEGWEHFEEGKKYKIPVGFMRYMATIVVGTARGIIHSRTEGTLLNSIVLPPINLVDAIKEDYIISE